MAKTLEELQVYQRALAAAEEVSAILERPALRKDLDLHDQLSTSSERIAAHIAEGFGQKTDRHFAHYLTIARGSCNEVRTHLTVACRRRHLPAAEGQRLCELYVVLGKMLTQFIKHLEREDRPRRG